MSFQKINKTRYPMVDELGRLMTQDMRLIQPDVDPISGRRYFFTPSEVPGSSDPVRRDLALEVYRHHHPDAPAATDIINPFEIIFIDGNPANCQVSNLKRLSGDEVETPPPADEAEIPSYLLDSEEIGAESSDEDSDIDTEVQETDTAVPSSETQTEIEDHWIEEASDQASPEPEQISEQPKTAESEPVSEVSAPKSESKTNKPAKKKPTSTKKK